MKQKNLIIEIAMVLALLLIAGGFVSKKEGFHQDEMLSFEFANAKFNPWIVPMQPQGRLAKFVENEIDGETFAQTASNLWREAMDVMKNRRGSKLLSYKADVYDEPVWISSEEFTDYITVGKGDAFHYFSVYFNSKDDNHPPLYYMVLHTVSSVFRGRADAWTGCLLNVLAAVGTLLILIRLGREAAEDFGFAHAGTVGAFCGGLYVFSTGMVASVLLIRMYALLSFFCVLFLAIVFGKWRTKGFEKRNVGLILITMCGFWTQYFFLFYCVLLAIVVAVGLARLKRMRELFCFIRSMAVAAVIGVCAFPFCIADVFSSERGVEALGNMTSGFSGYGTRLLAFLKILDERTLPLAVWGILAIVIAVCLGCLRFHRVRHVEKEMLPSTEGNGGLAETKDDLDQAADASTEKGFMIALLVLPCVGYFLLAARMSPYLVDRYLMPVFPIFLLIGGLGAAWAVSLLKRTFGQRGSLSKRLEQPPAAIVGALLLIVQFYGLVNYDGSYLFEGYDAQEVLSEEFSEDACICVYSGVTYYENLKEFTNYRQTLLLTQEELVARTDTESIRNQDKLVLLIKHGLDASSVLEKFTDQYDFLTVKSYEAIAPFGDSIFILQKGN